MRIQGISLTGLGLYPGDPCYDPNRPSLLPYWIDDFTESECYYNSTSILGATGNLIGQDVGTVVGAAGSAIGNAATSAVSQFTLSSGLALAGLGVLALLVVIMVTRK